MHDVDIQIKEIERALHNEEFRFYFQPKVSFVTGKILGGEALLRWILPDGTVIPPSCFLPQAEKSGLITDITAVMLPALIEEIEAIRSIRPDVQVAFNVSALDLHSPYLIKMLRSFIGARRIDPGNLQIEITESAVVEASQRIQATLNELVELGIEIVMDDFGTGYSSLDVLSRLPFSAIKLDQGVVRRMSEDAKNTQIVRSSLSMARELSIKTVAEGVETKGVYVYLMASGCDAVQGFWISRPIPCNDFISLLEENRKWPSSSLGLLYTAWMNHNSYRNQVLDSVYALALTEQEEWNHLPKTDLVHSPARCRLGGWYLSEARGNGGSAQFKLLEAPHRYMHAAGETLVKAALDGGSPDDIRQAIKAFIDYSEAVDAEVGNIVERWLGEALDGEE